MLGVVSLLGKAPSLREAYEPHTDSCNYRNNTTRKTVKSWQKLAHICHRRNVTCEAQPRQQDNRPSPVQDAQDTELAAADQQAKQDLYAQLLDRQQSSRVSEVSTSRNVQPQQADTKPEKPEKGSTELIFRLERRGEGWGEEIFPHLVVEQRPWTTTAKRDRNRSSRPKPWTVCFAGCGCVLHNLPCWCFLGCACICCSCACKHYHLEPAASTTLCISSNSIPSVTGLTNNAHQLNKACLEGSVLR